MLFFDAISCFIICRVQKRMIDDIHREIVMLIFSVHQGSVLDPLLFFLYTSDLPVILDSTLDGYADDSYLA